MLMYQITGKSQLSFLSRKIILKNLLVFFEGVSKFGLVITARDGTVPLCGIVLPDSYHILRFLFRHQVISGCLPTIYGTSWVCSTAYLLPFLPQLIMFILWLSNQLHNYFPSTPKFNLKVTRIYSICLPTPKLPVCNQFYNFYYYPKMPSKLSYSPYIFISLYIFTVGTPLFYPIASYNFFLLTESYFLIGKKHCIE